MGRHLPQEVFAAQQEKASEGRATGAVDGRDQAEGAIQFVVGQWQQGRITAVTADGLPEALAFQRVQAWFHFPGIADTL